MRHSLPAIAASLALLGACALPAAACINDREVGPKEREFKSHYQDNQPGTIPVQEISPATEQKLAPYAVLGAGSLLLAGAVVACVRKL
jgi:hypothetical protein